MTHALSHTRFVRLAGCAVAFLADCRLAATPGSPPSITVPLGEAEPLTFN